MKQFNSLGEFDAGQIASLLELADRLEKQPEPHALEGKVLSLLFLSPSLRTLASFQAAMIRLGGGTFVISPEMSIHGLESRSGIVMDGVAAEHIREAIPVIASYGDAIGIRAFAKREDLEYDLADSEFGELVSLIDKPWINMESAIHHPCQSLGDWKTLNDLNIPASGGKLVLSWTWHPRPLPLAVPASTLQFAAMRGMQVSVLRPQGFELPKSVMDKARTMAEISGGAVTETDDAREAMEGAHVVYANSWSSSEHYGERAFHDRIKPDRNQWCMSENWFDNARQDCRFMHCLPVRRGVAVTDELLDGSRSVVVEEARNRMLVQMAVLHRMLSGT